MNSNGVSLFGGLTGKSDQLSIFQYQLSCVERLYMSINHDPLAEKREQGRQIVVPTKEIEYN